MKQSEAAQLLVFVNSVEGRETTELQVAAWHELLADVDYGAAMDTVRDHYQVEDGRVWPAKIRRETVDSIGRDEWLARA